MFGPILNIVLGVLMIAGGLSGKIVLIGTDSSLAVTVLGVALVGLGVFRIARQRLRRD